MKGLHKILLALLFVALLLSNGCKPKDCHEDGTCAEDYRRMPLGEAKDYLLALPGSYWIYKNSVTGELDTQTCVSFLFDTVVVRGSNKETKHIIIEYERINRTIYSSFNKSEYSDITGFYNPESIRPLQALVFRHFEGQSINVFINPFDLNKDYENGNTITKCSRIDSVMNFGSNTFKKVVTFDINIDLIWQNGSSYTSSSYYWAKDVGLIKTYAKHYNFSWELIDYNIIR